MSYILDALRKAERDRHVSRVPTLATAHGGADLARRAQWAWAVAAGALALSAVVIYSLLWAPTRPDPVREAALPPAAAGPAVSRANAEPGAPAPPPARAPERTETAPALATGPAVEPPPAGRAPAQPRVAVVAPPAKTSRAARGADDDLRRAPERTGTPAAPATRQAAATEARPTPPAAVDREPIPEPRPGGDPAARPAAALAPAPLPDAGAGRTAQPAPAQTLARLTLDVLVYSDVPAERLVFINGRKYVEGQTVDGDAVVEQITPEGAVLRHQGRQLVLRPKLNPYARPGSP